MKLKGLKLSSLQKIAQGYVLQMDSLYTVNYELTEENLKIKEEIKTERRKNRQLEDLRVELSGMVDEASVLHAYNIEGNPVYVKGNGKEVITNKVRRVKRVRVCFTLGENSIIGAFSFVNDDIPDNVVAVGVPAKVIRNIVRER